MADQQPQPSLEHIMRISTGGWAAAILAAGSEHAVFTHLEKGADTVDALAKQAGISRRGAGALLDGLTGLGFLTVSNGRYRNTPDAAEFLVEGKRSYFGGFARVSLSSRVRGLRSYFLASFSNTFRPRSIARARSSRRIRYLIS